jgi:hypothetical protein
MDVTISPKMAFYWSINSVPELASLSKARRKEIWRECRKLKPLTWQFWIILAMGWAVIIVGLDELFPINPRPFVTFHLWNALRILICFGVVGIIERHFKIVTLLPDIRKRVGGLCLHCGYDLRGSPDLCPECGTASENKIMLK